MLTSPIQKYQQSSVQTASPGQLILMLYDGAIRFVKLGIAGIEERDISKANNSLIRAQRIINELMASLNTSLPLSATLMGIYEYMNRRLIEANIKKDKAPAEEVLGHLVELRDAWGKIIQPGQQGHA
ncbi:Flagellar protein fliS [Thermobacillus xylanilyticus]|uniref:Flagellar secretion chaperone FliS n=1 Tax=Thermobacillus xylanilyticus TaxID=76633 RepID=A0ABN7RY58_THEXY|nr:flagellar export chaperone FliS [Thermobacillus xylanilyticus]CAG5088536.1 Flagellar protein fliS [Thermobacillus xylanilyticus]